MAIFLVCSLSSGLASSKGPWPERRLDGTKVSIKNNPNRAQYQAYLGPGKGYALGGAYPTGKKGLSALLCENEYVLVDTGDRLVYFPGYAIVGAPDTNTVLTPYPAKTISDMQPMLGPGKQYESFMQRVRSEYADWSIKDLAATFGGSYEIAEALRDKQFSITLEAGTSVSVFFETNGWVFAETEIKLKGKNMGLARAWFPADQVRSN